VLARTTGQAVANISHHLRVLAEAGLIEEAPDLARNRKEHWWRMLDHQLTWELADFTDAADLAAADAAMAIGLQRQVELTSTWLGSPASREAPWTGAAFSTDGFLNLSPAELTAMAGEIQDVIDRYFGRPAAPGREPVFVLSRGFPARP
jgi:hypothetical protein